MRNALLFLTALVISTQSFAQFRYDLTVQTSTYQPLTSGTSLNGSTIWDDEYYTIPLGFNFSLDGQTINTISSLSAQNCLTDTTGVASGFFITDIDLHDRGNAGGSASVSPIAYQVTGSSPNRIFKLEVKNAGMYDEYDLYSTNDDSLSYQLWLYETTNVVEIHYGDSKISHPTDYFFTTGSPIVGFVRNMDISGFGTIDVMYYLKGSATAPTIDSTSTIFSLTGGLNSYPPSGTVYRFSPKPVSVNNITKADINVALLSNSVQNTMVLTNNSKSITTYKVISTNGASMNVAGSLHNGSNTVDVSSLASGMYILYVQNGEGRKAFQFVKM